jgi:hypothetical protein
MLVLVPEARCVRLSMAGSSLKGNILGRFDSGEIYVYRAATAKR